MEETQNIVLSDDWSANDYSNIITISSAAIASVLLVVFKSRCSNISVCYGLFSCNRKIKEDAEDEEEGGGEGGGADDEVVAPPN